MIKPIEPTKEDIENLKNVFLNHNFDLYRNLTKTNRACEVLNLQKEDKFKLLNKLSIKNDTINFNEFWLWFRKNCGMNFAKQFSNHLYPTNLDYAQKNYNQMRASKEHPFWNHVQSRIYKMWCSIITEKQCIHSLYEYSNNNNKNWNIYSSVELDSGGIDLVIECNNKWLPIQIKKDSFTKIAQSKQNSNDNLSRFQIKSQKKQLLLQQLSSVGFNLENLEPGLLLKYTVPNNNAIDNQINQNYIDILPNGFVFFKSQEIGQLIETFFIDNTLNNNLKFKNKI